MSKWNRNRGKQTDPLAEAATQSAPKPGDYELGSVRSRAAARAMLEEKETGKLVIKIHFTSRPGAPMAKTPYRVEYGPNATLELYNDGDDCEQQETDTKPS